MNLNLIEQVAANQLNYHLPKIVAGDRVSVAMRIQEANKSRLQNFEGVVIKTQGRGINVSILVRKNSKNVYIERIFPLHSPLIENVRVLSHGRVRQARIYYMRNRHGKAARLKEVRRNS